MELLRQKILCLGSGRNPIWKFKVGRGHHPSFISLSIPPSILCARPGGKGRTFFFISDSPLEAHFPYLAHTSLLNSQLSKRYLEISSVISDNESPVGGGGGRVSSFSSCSPASAKRSPPQQHRRRMHQQQVRSTLHQVKLKVNPRSLLSGRARRQQLPGQPAEAGISAAAGALVDDDAAGAGGVGGLRGLGRGERHPRHRQSRREGSAR